MGVPAACRVRRGGSRARGAGVPREGRPGAWIGGERLEERGGRAEEVAVLLVVHRGVEALAGGLPLDGDGKLLLHILIICYC